MPGRARFLSVLVPAAVALMRTMQVSERAFWRLDPHRRSCLSYSLSVAMAITVLCQFG